MSLKNCVVALSGTFGKETHGDIGQTVKDAGGEYFASAKLDDGVTHLVVSEKHWETGRKVPKLRVALAPGSKIKIVSLDWVQASAKSKRKVSESKYLMQTPKAEDDADVKAEDDDQDEPAPTKKRSRGAKTKDAKVKKEDEDEADDVDQEPPAKKAKAEENGQIWRAGVKIPRDTYCNLGPNFEVYVDDDSLVWDASLNQTNAGNNNNKFYMIQLLVDNTHGGDYQTWTRWGRVGESGASASLGDHSLEDATNHFQKKFKDKTGLKWQDRLEAPKPKKYAFLERNYEDDSDEDMASKKKEPNTDKDAPGRPESTLTLPVQQLMTLIFNTENFANAMAAMNYDSKKMPLGKLSKTTLTRGFEALKKLAEVITDESLAQKLHQLSFKAAVEEFSNSYYTLIPHSFGRDRPPIIQTEAFLKREIELLESLSDMEISNKIMKEAKADMTETLHPLDRQYQGLGMTEMTALGHDSNEFKQLQEYLVQSTGKTHSVAYKVEAIFRIDRQGDFDRFSQSPFANFQSGDRRLLWHGSRATNFGGILSQGLRIAPPEAPVSGYMFGKGIYLADISSKSAGYTQAHASGGVGLLLLCEAELGKPMLELYDSNYNAGEEAKKQNSFSTWGKGITAPQGWKDAGCVNESLKGVTMPDMSKPPGPSGTKCSLLYNEYICYDVAQIRLRYLFRVKMQ